MPPGASGAVLEGEKKTNYDSCKRVLYTLETSYLLSRSAIKDGVYKLYVDIRGGSLGRGRVLPVTLYVIRLGDSASQTNHNFIQPRGRLGVAVVGDSSASKCLSGTKSCAIS